jgi:hypothetical protein
MANPNGKKGSSFERLMADWFKWRWSRYVDRKVKTGGADEGDIGNFYVGDFEVTIECKNLKSYDLAGAVSEAEAESVNAGTLCGVAIVKRRGKGKPEDQYVVMTAQSFIKLLKAAGGGQSA